MNLTGGQAAIPCSRLAFFVEKKHGLQQNIDPSPGYAVVYRQVSRAPIVVVGRHWSSLVAAGRRDRPLNGYVNQ